MDYAVSSFGRPFGHVRAVARRICTLPRLVVCPKHSVNNSWFSSVSFRFYRVLRGKAVDGIAIGVGTLVSAT